MRLSVGREGGTKQKFFSPNFVIKWLLGKVEKWEQFSQSLFCNLMGPVAEPCLPSQLEQLFYEVLCSVSDFI